ncbi:hypothetical protein JW933_08025 [candidate division FCPU426 bacterium]|nr:hypothetical protein [candidate division FCPU426 bacterium]
MRDLFNRFAIAYLAGAIGGLAYALIAWLCDHWHLFKLFSVQMSVVYLSWPYLAERILKGSLWALLLVFLGPFFKARGALLGLILSLIPSAYVLLIYYPGQQLGFLGLAKGVYTFIFVLLFNAAWGFIAGGIYAHHYRS